MELWFQESFATGQHLYAFASQSRSEVVWFQCSANVLTAQELKTWHQTTHRRLAGWKFAGIPCYPRSSKKYFVCKRTTSLVMEIHGIIIMIFTQGHHVLWCPLAETYVLGCFLHFRWIQGHKRLPKKPWRSPLAKENMKKLQSPGLFFVDS